MKKFKLIQGVYLEYERSAFVEAENEDAALLIAREPGFEWEDYVQGSEILDDNPVEVHEVIGED